MWEQIEALWAAVRQLQAQVKPLVPPEPPPPIPTEDPAKAKLDYEAAQLEVKAQQERAAVNVKIAQEAEARAKAILDKSVSAVGAEHPPAEHPEPRPAPRR